MMKHFFAMIYNSFDEPQARKGTLNKDLPGSFMGLQRQTKKYSEFTILDRGDESLDLYLHPAPPLFNVRKNIIITIDITKIKTLD